ncbi:putative ATP-dependent RNA helicase TDRD12 isoform X2 [Cynoglossus semilaevis]|uniref:putative ATP-dependent RNA helicase TDRD12 isoform X2 n=1 Tax=Cynoglossus semilaevis TaxID=244447 RepID=UPI0007DC840D|nr:putative ATP-dependent RNA helicase TDRD12 isoform X2 [Cynoglossus semilaevis]
MSKISILKVENPSCLWGRVCHPPKGSKDKTDHYNFLAQMNLFYHNTTLDQHLLKPKLVEGEVFVVYWSMIKSWCRAVVESVITDSVSCRARCLLVDYGERLIVDKGLIRVAVKKFLELPFWVRRFQLAGIKPTTLRVSVEKAELMPSSQWDSSATLYLHNLLQASTLTEAVLFETKSDSTSIELYLTVNNIKICVNDDLVAKKFAYYNQGSGECSRSKELDRIAVTFFSSVLTQTVPDSNQTAVETPPSPVISSSPVSGLNVDWLTASSSPQGQDDVTITEADDRPTVSPQLFSVGQSGSSSQHATANVCYTSHSTDSTSTKDSNLLKFMTFLNPGCSFQQTNQSIDEHEEPNNKKSYVPTSMSCSEQEAVSSLHNGESTTGSRPLTDNTGSRPVTDLCSSEKIEATGLEVNHVENDTSGDTRSDLSESGSTEATKMCRAEVHWACSRLLEWMNPTPLNSAPESGDEAVIPSDPMGCGVLVHSVIPIQPCTSLDDAPVTDAFRCLLRRRQYCTLSLADRYGWPAVSRGRNTIIISHSATEPLSYLPPLLSHVLLNTIFCSFTSSAGPIVVLLCPNWEKVQTVYDLLVSTRIAHALRPFILLLGIGKDEVKTVRIPKNCLLLVTTPFSLVRLMSVHCFMFLRLCHLLLDEADSLFVNAPNQMATILQHYQKVTSSEGKASCPQQLVAVAKQWSTHMVDLVTTYMPYPCVVISNPEDAALYGNVQQLILMSSESSKILELLGTLDSSPDVGQKTLIITNSAQEVENVFVAVKNKSLFCLKAHEGLTDQFDLVIKEWKKNIGHGSHVIMVTTNECLKCFGIRDATCVIHYGFPTSPKLFGSRLFCMSDNFRNLSERVLTTDQTRGRPEVTKSVLLISEKNASHVVGVLRYLQRTDALLPAQLLSFAQSVITARENLKTNRPLCSYLKSFGVCRDSSSCPDRHKFSSELDQSELPASGVIEVVPVHVKTASVFYGRVISKSDNGFESLASEMASYYVDNKPGAEEVLVGGLYAVEEDKAFHRVKILSVLDRSVCGFFRAFVRFIDVGKEEEVKCYQILQLPEKFHSLPAQAVEIIVCSVKPGDAEINWHPKATRAISQRVKGLQHRARAVFSLGNTVFVDSMVRVTQVPGMRTVINEYAVQSEILKTGLGVSNPEHLDLLRELCQEADTNSGPESSQMNGLNVDSLTLENDVRAEGDLQCNDTRINTMNKPTIQEPALQHHLDHVCDQTALSESQAADEHVNNQTMKLDLDKRVSDEEDELSPPTDLAACSNTCTDGFPPDKNPSSVQQNTVSTPETESDASVKSFHPLMTWYQTPDSVIVTVKLINPESQCCDFYSDRVTYSAGVKGRTYRAVLELYSNIDADRCHWEMKSNEPVIKLVKQQQGHWEKFLRNKNIFVSYDMNHVEEDEDRGSVENNGTLFFGSTGEDNCYVNSEDGESDSD